MKYTAKPVTQYARNKKAAASAPAKRGKTKNDKPASAPAVPAAAAAPTAASANSSQQSNSSTINDKVNKGGLSWNRSLTTSNSSGDANSLTNVSAPANDLGKAKGGRQASTAAEKSSYNDWVIDQVSSGKQSAQHMADQKYISKDRVGEYAKYAPKPKAFTSSKDSDSSRKETLTPDMTEAVAPKTQTQTRSYQKARQNRQWIRSNAINRIAASSQVRRAKRDGMFADGELTDKGRSSLSPEQQKGLSGAYDTKRGRNADQLAHTNRTGKWAHGGNTAVGETFETEAGKASTQRKAQEGQETIDTAENKSGGVTEGTQVANNAATRVQSKFGDFSSSKDEADRIMAGVNKGTSKGANKVAAEATEALATNVPEVSTKPQTRKEKQSFNKDRRKEASADRQAKRQDARDGRQASRKANKAERVAKRGVKAAGGADAVQSGKTFDDAGQAPKTSLVNKPSNEVTISAGPKPEVKFTEQTWKPANAKSKAPVGTVETGLKGTKGAHSAYSEQQEANDIFNPKGSTPANYKMNRLHSSGSPAKMWNTDVSPAKEGETLKHAPKNAKKVAAKEKADKNARWAAASPAKMWGPSKVKAGKDGFNRKK